MLSKILANLLEERNISLSELSRATKVPKSNISAWMKGRSPNIDQIDLVAKYFEVPIEYLMFGRKLKSVEPTLMYRTEVETGKYEIIVRKISE